MGMMQPAPHLRGRALVLLRLQRGRLRLRLGGAQLRLQRGLLLAHLRLHLHLQLALERHLRHLLPRLRTAAPDTPVSAHSATRAFS